jgi:Bacterial Ig-like domain (group 2)
MRKSIPSIVAALTFAFLISCSSDPAKPVGDPASNPVGNPVGNPNTPTLTATQPDSVVLNTPANFNGKLITNKPVQFTAQARNGTNLLTPAPTITWTSSDPNVVGVDANGLVTAKKFNSGNVTITASVGSVQSTPAAITMTYGMEAAIGTISGDGLLGTAFLLHLRDANGEAIDNQQEYQISAPGWNDELTANTYGLRLDSLAYTAATEAEYTIKSRIYDETASAYTTYVAKAQIAAGGLSTPLPIPVLTTATVTGTGASRNANLTWNTVPGAGMYQVEVYELLIPKTGSLISKTFNQKTTSTTLSIPVDFIDNASYSRYSVTVTALPVDYSASSTLPASLNVSIVRSDLTVTP